MEYFKINSLWKRQDYEKGLPKGSHGPLLEGQYSEWEFENIKRWSVEEKIDGTNVRILYNQSGPGEPFELTFAGRTSNAQMPCHLLKKLQELFSLEKFNQVFPEARRVVLFGEGYGPKIQACGGNYSKEVGFILFDVYIDGWWLKREDVKIISERLLIPMVPQLGIMTEEEVVDFVKSKPISRCSLVPQMMEGVVCRSEPLMLFRNGNPMIWKLKCKEFI